MLKDILFPRLCLSCGFLGGYICENCRKKLLSIYKNQCLYCERHSLFGLTHPSCLRMVGIDGCISGFYYNPNLKKIIKAIKYRLVKEAVPELFGLINENFFKTINRLTKDKANVFIQSIPLSEKRLKERGFNLAELFSSHIQSIVDIKKGDFLKRIGNPLPQAQIKEKEKRIKNLTGTFVVKNEKQIKKAIIVLVDDVVTTGATIKEAAKKLKKSGAENIFAVTIAKG